MVEFFGGSSSWFADGCFLALPSCSIKRDHLSHLSLLIGAPVPFVWLNPPDFITSPKAPS